MAEKIIGIDLGTTNSVVAVMIGDEPVVIANQEGSRLTPSVVSWTKEKEVLVGEPAKRRAILDPENTVYESKRFIGRKYEEVLGNPIWAQVPVVGNWGGSLCEGTGYF